MFEYVTAERLRRMSRVSYLALTCLPHTLHVADATSPSCHGACINASHLMTSSPDFLLLLVGHDDTTQGLSDCCDTGESYQSITRARPFAYRRISHMSPKWFPSESL